MNIRPRFPHSAETDALIEAAYAREVPRLAELAALLGTTVGVIVGRAYRKGWCRLERQAAATKANWQDPEFRERNAAATKANWQDPEFRERNAAAVKSANSLPASVAASIDGALARNARPADIALSTGASLSTVYRAKKRVALATGGGAHA
ncbi:MAG: hypothetical protein ACRC56_11985 [Bosea sp. (in: a-proteobacteria)]